MSSSTVFVKEEFKLKSVSEVILGNFFIGFLLTRYIRMTERHSGKGTR